MYQLLNVKRNVTELTSVSVIVSSWLLQETCVEFEASVVAQVDNLIEALKQRKQQLISNIQEERDQKLRIYKEQLAHCTQKLQKTTGLLQFSIEVLKESDPGAFLQVNQIHYLPKHLFLFCSLVHPASLKISSLRAIGQIEHKN